MKNVVFLAHWSLAFIEEQFYALFSKFKNQASKCKFIYFCDWDNESAVKHLVENLFEQSEIKPTYNHFPPFDKNLFDQHPILQCTTQDTLFIVQFNPSHLRHFLAATGNRFPRRYYWWQIEQKSNHGFFSDNVYSQAISNAQGVLEFSDETATLYCPFICDTRLLLYDTESDDAGSRIRNIAQHQALRQRQDNRRFVNKNPPPALRNQVLLLGTCEVLQRQFFKKLCVESGIPVLHPFSFNYLFALERQKWIQDFVKVSHDCGQQAIAVNIHQYNDSHLETGKIFLLLANGCDVVLSERSVCRQLDARIEKFCHPRLIFCDSIRELVKKITQLRLVKTFQVVEYPELKDWDEKALQNILKLF